MKGLLISPPQWYPGNPYPAIPLLLGQLKRAGYDAKGMDVNIDFYNHILTKDYLERSIKRAKDMLTSISEELIKYTETSEKRLQELVSDNLLTDFLNNIQSQIKKQSAIGRYFMKYPDKLMRIPQEIEAAVKTLKSPELFYNPELLFKAKEVIFDALKIASLPFFPAELSFANYYNPDAMGDCIKLKSGCFNTSTNMFIEYYEKIIPDIIHENADYIIISAADISQLIPAFTLARMIKENCETPICIGGNITTKLLNGFKNNCDLAKSFCNILSYGDGEKSIVALAGYFKGSIPIEDVPGIIYRNKSGIICDNGMPADTDLNDVADFSFEGIEFDKYFSPEPVFSVKLSKGCYWGNCAFCDVSYNRKYFRVLDPLKAVESFKKLKESYNIKNFILGDDSVSPEYYSKLSKLLIEHDLNINIFSWTRLEEGFTEEILREMADAGCKSTFWGYESESDRVMEQINKGVNYNKRLEIMKNAEKAGIWNHVAYMVGFPTETEAEAQLTLNILRNHRDIVNSCYISKFSFKKNAPIAKCPEAYNITYFKSKGDMQLDYEYESNGMSDSDKKLLVKNFKSEFLTENINRLWPMLCVDFEYLLLYLSHYGRDWVKDFRLKTIPESVTGFLASL
ncbi:MAG: radical SAM protein [Eubacteriales bacterium]